MKKQYISICALLCSAVFASHANATSALNTELLFSTELLGSYGSIESLSGKENTSEWEMAALSPVMLTLAEIAPSTASGGQADAPLTDKKEVQAKKPTPAATKLAQPQSSAPVRQKKASPPTRQAPVISTRVLFNSAKRALQQGNRAKALQHLSALLRKQPGHRSARLMYGTELVKDAQYAEASLILPELLNDSMDWHAWYWMGTASLMLGNLKDAENYLSEALARNGEIAALWVQRAIIEQESNNHHTALQLLNIAKDLDPDMPEISLNIAYSADALGNRNLANHAYGKFLVQTSKSPKHIRVRQKVLSLF